MKKYVVGVALGALLLCAGCSALKAPSPASARNTTGSNAQVVPKPGILGPADVAAKLQASGFNAQATGEKIKELLGAIDAEVVVVGGTPIQVYIFAGETEARAAFQTASTPQAHTISWATDPQFVLLGNLLITVGGNDQAAVAEIIKALQDQLSENDVISHLTKHGLEPKLQSSIQSALTPLGTANVSRVLVGQKEISISVFASDEEAARGIERGLENRYPKPTTLILWKNIVVVVTRSDDAIGTRTVAALEPVAERVVITP